MKNIVLPFVLLICFQVYSQRKPKIKGNRDVIEVQERLPPFRAIELKDDLKIELAKAPEEGYAIEADDNLVDVLKFEVEDSTLIISSFYKITGKKKLDITVNYNYLDALTLRNGDIRMEDAIVSDYLDVKTYESARLQLNAEASQIDIDMEGNSSGDFVLTGDAMNFALKDRIDVRIYTDSGTNDFKMYKTASATMEGMVDSLNVDLFENSSLKGRRLVAKKAYLNLQDSPSAEVNVQEEMELTSSGSSRTYLYGDGKIKIIDFLDTSELHKKK
jgi:hypothetical protein